MFLYKNFSESNQPAIVGKTGFIHAGDDEQTSLWSGGLFQ